MPSDLTLNVQPDPRTTRLFAQLPERVREKGIRSGLLKSAILLGSHIKLTKLSGNPLHARSGRLRSSIAHRIEGRGDEQRAVVGTRLVYARIHEYGGIIRAKRAPYLVFPIKGIRTTGASGALLKRPRLETTGWVRVKQVTIPKRSYLRISLVEKHQEILETVNAEIKKAIEPT